VGPDGLLCDLATREEITAMLSVLEDELEHRQAGS